MDGAAINRTRQRQLVDAVDTGTGSRFHARSVEGRRSQVVVGKDPTARRKVISTYSTAVRNYRKPTASPASAAAKVTPAGDTASAVPRPAL